jgi:hypothetical protein
MAHEPCEEASRPKHGKKNITWRGVGGGTCLARDFQDYSHTPSGLDIACLECDSWARTRIYVCIAHIHLFIGFSGLLNLTMAAARGTHDKNPWVACSSRPCPEAALRSVPDASRPVVVHRNPRKITPPQRTPQLVARAAHSANLP